MNRELKFRAFDKDNKQMIYSGSNVDRVNGVMEARFSFDEADCCLLVRHYCENEWYPINNIEVMQFTGLHDKNGKEIYEGDKYSWNVGRNPEVGTIVFFDGMFACRPDNALDSQKDFSLNSMNATLEVIGNIWEAK